MQPLPRFNDLTPPPPRPAPHPRGAPAGSIYRQRFADLTPTMQQEMRALELSPSMVSAAMVDTTPSGGPASASKVEVVRTKLQVGGGGEEGGAAASCRWG